jgi:hypothetical protein
MSQGTNLTIENRRAGGMASGHSRRLNTAVSLLISLPPVTSEERDKLRRAVDAIPTHESETVPAPEPVVDVEETQTATVQESFKPKTK